MQVKRIDNTNFNALIKIKSPEELIAQANKFVEQMPPNAKAMSGTSSLTGVPSLSTGSAISGSAMNTAATTSDVIATAYFAKYAGVDSFGIVPSAAAKTSPYATPATMASSAQHPETAGTIFSGLGAWLHSHFRIIDNKTKKIPS